MQMTSSPLKRDNADLNKLITGIRTTQGRRRVFKSGPAEEIIECRRHERGRAQEGGPNPPLSLGGLPRENFELLALLCAF